MRHAAWLVACLLMASAPARALTICAVPCGTSTDTYQYAYQGYLQDLSVSSSRELPFNLNEFYGLLGVSPGAAVPVNLSLAVRQSQEYLGDYVSAPWYDYWYSMSLGDTSIYGSVINGQYYGASPLEDNVTDPYGNTVDRVAIRDLDYAVLSGQSSLELRSRSTETPGVISIQPDYFHLSLTDESAQALDSIFPPDNMMLESLFSQGEFRLSGDLRYTADNGEVLVPFSEAEVLRMSGSFTSATVLFEPAQDGITTTCGTNLGGCLDGGGIILMPQVPIPGAGVLMFSGLLGLFTLFRKRK